MLSPAFIYTSIEEQVRVSCYVTNLKLKLIVLLEDIKIAQNAYKPKKLQDIYNNTPEVAKKVKWHNEHSEKSWKREG